MRNAIGGRPRLLGLLALLVVAIPAAFIPSAIAEGDELDPAYKRPARL